MYDVKEYQKKYQKEYQKINREKLRNYHQKWENQNRDKLKEYHKKNRKYFVDYYQNNKEKLREYSKEYRKEYEKNNKEKLRKIRREYRKKAIINNPQKYHIKSRRISLKKLYGITIEIYDEMYTKQKGLCKICLKSKNEKDRYLNIDHCHKTGKVRGLLCRKCNLMLGLIDDNILILDNIKKYLTN